MIQTAIDYAKELHKAGMTHEELSSVKDIFDVAKVPGFLHVCGQTIKHTDYMVKTGAQVLSIDYMTDIKKCLEMVPEDVVIMGNVSPILLKMGTLEEL